MLTRENPRRVKTLALGSDSPCPPSGQAEPATTYRETHLGADRGDARWYKTSSHPGNDAHPTRWVCTFQRLIAGGRRGWTDPDDSTEASGEPKPPAHTFHAEFSLA